MADRSLLPKPDLDAMLQPVCMQRDPHRLGGKETSLARRKTILRGLSRNTKKSKSVPTPRFTARWLQSGTVPVWFDRPVHPHSSMCLEIASQLHRLHLNASWFSLIPSRLGRNQAVDTATNALIQAHRFSFEDQSAPPETCWRSYGKAIDSLQLLMSSAPGRTSDDALLTCTILAQFERTMGFQSDGTEIPIQKTLTHLRGLEAIILSRPHDQELSELTEAILSGCPAILFEMPVAFGCSSPFERFAPLDLGYAHSKFRFSYISQLRKLGYTQRVHLPRLIMYTREWMTDQETRAHVRNSGREEAITLARYLLVLKNEAAENALLHNVRIRRSTFPWMMARNQPFEVETGPEDDIINSYSFDFMSLTEYEGAIYYWHSQILTLRICWRIGSAGLFDCDAIAAEGRRTAQNIMMAWEYGVQHGLFGRIRLLHAVPALWGAITDFGPISNWSSSALRCCMLNRLEDFSGLIFRVSTVQDLDDVAASQAGGKVTRPMVRLFGQPRRSTITQVRLE